MAPLSARSSREQQPIRSRRENEATRRPPRSHEGTPGPGPPPRGTTRPPLPGPLPARPRTGTPRATATAGKGTVPYPPLRLTRYPCCHLDLSEARCLLGTLRTSALVYGRRGQVAGVCACAVSRVGRLRGRGLSCPQRLCSHRAGGRGA